MTRAIVLGIGASLLSGCLMSLPTYDRQQAPDLHTALDSAPRGSTGQIDATTSFVILDTRSKPTLLCRTVLIYTDKSDVKQEYCKVRGGEWK